MLKRQQTHTILHQALRLLTAAALPGFLPSRLEGVRAELENLGNLPCPHAVGTIVRQRVEASVTLTVNGAELFLLKAIAVELETFALGTTTHHVLLARLLPATVALFSLGGGRGRVSAGISSSDSLLLAVLFPQLVVTLHTEAEVAAEHAGTVADLCVDSERSSVRRS